MKRLIKPSELWLPPHVRRTPSQPPSGRRFLPSRRCCCGEVRDCDRCTNPPAQMAVDLSGLTLASGAGGCNDCPTYPGIYTLTWNDADDDPATCQWDYCDDTVDCDAYGVSYNLWIRAGIALAPRVWGLFMGSRSSNCTNGVLTGWSTWSGSTWVGDDCMDAADPDDSDKITLGFVNTLFPQFWCTGAAGNIKIWDASA